jgi:hypothetical protein
MPKTQRSYRKPVFLHYDWAVGLPKPDSFRIADNTPRSRKSASMSPSAWRQQLISGEALFDYRPSVQIDQLFGFDVTRERRTASRVVRSLREFASPDSKSIQPSLKPSIIRILGVGCFVPCERNSVSHWSCGTASARTGRSSAAPKPAAISFAE